MSLVLCRLCRLNDRLTAEIVDELDASLIKVPVSLVFLQEIPVSGPEMFLERIFLDISKYSLTGNPAVLGLSLHLCDGGQLGRGTHLDISLVAQTEGSTSDFPKQKWRMVLEVRSDLIDCR